MKAKCFNHQFNVFCAECQSKAIRFADKMAARRTERNRREKFSCKAFLFGRLTRKDAEIGKKRVKKGLTGRAA
jgi:hypothetical protein